MSDHQHEENLRAQREALDASAKPGSEGPTRRSARGALARFLAGEFYRRPTPPRDGPGDGPGDGASRPATARRRPPPTTRSE